MSDFLTIEPAPELAGRFAVWCLGRDANVQTVSAGGFLVPLDWYSDIPSELLAGAHVDGFALDVAIQQPEAVRAPLTALDGADGTETPGPDAGAVTPPLTAETKATAKKPATRKPSKRVQKRAPGAYTRKPTDVAAEAAATFSSSEGSE